MTELILRLIQVWKVQVEQIQKFYTVSKVYSEQLHMKLIYIWQAAYEYWQLQQSWIGHIEKTEKNKWQI